MTDELYTVRASSMPLAMACPGSLRAEVPVDEQHPAASDGSAAHVLLADLPTEGEIAWSKIADVAKQLGADPDEVRMLCACGVRLWKEVEDSFPDAQTEVELEHVAAGLWLTGHADIASITGTVGRVGDWKGGRVDTDYVQQMLSYAALTLFTYPDLLECTSTILWLREKEIENYTMSRGEALDWIGEARERIVEWDGVFHSGTHCKYCRRSHECVAANALARRDCAAMADADLMLRAETALATMTANEIIDLNATAKHAESMAKRVRETIKAHVLANGDVAGSGGRLTITETNPRRLQPREAWGVLQRAGFTDADFAECMTLGVTKVEKRVAKNAGKGKGAAAVRALGVELEKADAVQTKPSRSLVHKRT